MAFGVSVPIDSLSEFCADPAQTLLAWRGTRQVGLVSGETLWWTHAPTLTC